MQNKISEVSSLVWNLGEGLEAWKAERYEPCWLDATGLAARREREKNKNITQVWDISGKQFCLLSAQGIWLDEFVLSDMIQQHWH